MLYENMTFENIMDRCLSRVAASIDKREGSVVYDAIAPAAAELAIMYIELAYLLDRAFPDTEEGDDLTLKCQERSVFRTPATAAVRKGYFEDGDGEAMDVPIGSRYSGDALNYVVTEKIATGQFKLLCETAGAAGNQYQGNLFPIDYVEGLGAARLADILINGEDEESDADLLARYKESLESQAYGGNIADYRTKVELLQGVGAVKVFPVWNGGGTVGRPVFDPGRHRPDRRRPHPEPGRRRRDRADRPRRHRRRRHRNGDQRVLQADLRHRLRLGHREDRRHEGNPGLLRGPGEGLGEPVGDHRPRVPGGNEGPVRGRRDRHHGDDDQRRNPEYRPGVRRDPRHGRDHE